jgi:hypothetical protein
MAAFMQEQDTAPGTYCIEIIRLDPRSFVKVFAGIISSIAVILALCCLLFEMVLLRGNMVFLPRAYADVAHGLTIPTIIWWICAVVILSIISGFLIAAIHNAIVRRTGGIRIQIKK